MRARGVRTRSLPHGLCLRHRLGPRCLELVLDTLQYLVVRDWEKFAPHAAFVKTRYEVPFDARGRSEWLVKEARLHLEREYSAAGAAPKRP